MKNGIAGGTTGQYLVKKSSTNYDYEWQSPAGTGTVTSVGVSVPTGLSVAGSPVTTSGTIAISYASGYTGYTSAEATKLAGVEAGAQVNAVTSVAGKTGAITLAKGDVGLGNVDNTSDANKPVSTAQQTALNAKANSAVTLTAGTGLTGGGNLSSNRSFAVSYGTTGGTAAQGNDGRLSDAREWTAATVSQTDAEAGTATDRRAWTSERVRQNAAAVDIGVGQTWQDVTASRARNTVYQNTTGKPILVIISHNSDNAGTVEVSSDGSTWIGIGNVRTGGTGIPQTFIVPPVWRYRTGGSFGVWSELS